MQNFWKKKLTHFNMYMYIAVNTSKTHLFSSTLNIQRNADWDPLAPPNRILSLPAVLVAYPASCSLGWACWWAFPFPSVQQPPRYWRLWVWGLLVPVPSLCLVIPWLLPTIQDKNTHHYFSVTSHFLSILLERQKSLTSKLLKPLSNKFFCIGNSLFFLI